MNVEKLKKNTIRKVWWLHFKDGHVPQELKGENDFVFGTKAAIYEVFDKSEIGITLWSLQCKSGDLYQNDKVVLRKIPHVTKPIQKTRTSNL